jgi:hypothetical protein
MKTQQLLLNAERPDARRTLKFHISRIDNLTDDEEEKIQILNIEDDASSKEH